MWRFSLDATARDVSHHIYIPSHLISFLYRLYILVESFTFLVTDVIKVFREVMEKTLCKIQLNAYVAASPLSHRLSRCGMKICPAWSAVRKTSNINIDGSYKCCNWFS